mgnify:CR=1 FL=1
MKFSGLAALGAAAAFGLAGCGTITQGTTQEIAVSSAPSGAHCTMTRNGILIAKVKKTPESVKVNKRKYAILLNCEHDGYQPASLTLESGYGAGTFGNILLGGVVGWGIDSATGADNKYPSTASIDFTAPAKQTAAPQAAPAQTATPQPPANAEPAITTKPSPTS